MAYCPKCKEEYEDDVKMCGDCNVELVQSLEDIHNERMLMVVNSEEEATKAIEFLKYSNVESGAVKEAHNEHGEHVFVIHVDENDWNRSTKVMQGYVMTEKEEPNMEDYYFDEYETIDLDAEVDLAEIKSSYTAFFGVGGVLTVLGILELVGITSFLPGNMPIMFAVIGVIFVTIGNYTRAGLGKKTENVTSVKDEFQRLYQLYLDRYPVEKFYDRHKIKLDGMDEGAKYFALMDVIVKECQAMKVSEDDKMINTIAEKVYNQL